MNDPRCDLLLGPEKRQCLNQAAGFMLYPRRIALCDDHRLDLESQAEGITEPWEPLHPAPMQQAIERRVELAREGYFG